MTSPTAFVPVSSVFVTIGKGHFTLSMSFSLNKFPSISSSIGLHHITYWFEMSMKAKTISFSSLWRTKVLQVYVLLTYPMSPIVFILSRIDVIISVHCYSSALPLAFKPLSDIIWINAAFKAHHWAISMREWRRITKSTKLTIRASYEGYLTCV